MWFANLNQIFYPYRGNSNYNNNIKPKTKHTKKSIRPC